MKYGWKEYAESLTSDRERYEYLSEVLTQMHEDAEADGGLAAQFQASFGMTRQQGLICARLMQSLGNPVPWEIIISAMECGEDTEDPRNVLGAQLCRLKKLLPGGRIWIDTITDFGLVMHATDDLLRSQRFVPGRNAPTGTGTDTPEQVHMADMIDTLRMALSAVRAGRALDVMITMIGSGDGPRRFRVLKD